jgi:hypothetical protein
MGRQIMEFRFEFLIQGHGVPDAVDMDAMRLLEAFEDLYGETGPAIGIDVKARVLEVSFSAGGVSLEEAAERARRMLSEVADAARWRSIDVIDFAGQPEGDAALTS